MVTTQRYLVALLWIILTACTGQQYYEGLKAGHRASCLEYPESEYKDCIDETGTSYEEYKQQREQAIGNQPVD
jgi:hypothetical protein